MLEAAIFVIGTILLTIILAAIWLGMTFNRLRALEARCEQAEQDIDVQLRRRSDLLPNLTSTVRSYVEREDNLIDTLRQIQIESNSISGIRNRSKNAGNITANMASVFASLDSIPELKSSSHYQALRSEIMQIEDQIEAARRFLNLAAAEFNKVRAQFPGSLIAGRVGIGKRQGYSLGAERVFHDEAPTLNI